MTYDEAIDFLFAQVAAFHQVGAGAYKPGLERVASLSARFGNPHLNFPTVHVAGTNGKGSVSSTLAAIFQSAGYRTGLFTSPHLVDFRERIRVDGQMISRDDVMQFLDRAEIGSGKDCPSFFELTTVMAFDHFSRHNVDIAIVEVGLGGRLDSTNIIHPDLSVITNISLDHTALLGDTPEAIAAEKAGIIKYGVPVVVGEAADGVRRVFEEKAAKEGADIYFAEDRTWFTSVDDNGAVLRYATPEGTVEAALRGACQPKNTATLLAAVEQLRRCGWKLSFEAVARGFGHVNELTGLAGRWQRVGENPTVICDTGHNVGGWQYTVENLNSIAGRKILVIGFVNDKDVRSILRMIDGIDNAALVLTNASVQRALPAEELATIVSDLALNTPIAAVLPSVAEAAAFATQEARYDNATVFIGGSTFVVADYLSTRVE